MSASLPHAISSLTHLGDMPIATFLAEYWQKKPLLIRKAFPNFSSPLSADEIAGLTLDDDVVCRLALENEQNGSWTVEHGPLPEDIFTSLPESRWTLLVQHADSLDPEVNQLLNSFRFIPNWRLDDIMVSYAPDGGGVGPHFDYFDVFLLQGEGERRWRLGQKCDSQSPLLPDQPMKILASFDTSEDWTVNAGDLLYIPAQVAHWGEAIGESITYSIGFRAPSHSELLLEFAQEASAACTEDQRYADPDLQIQNNPGEIAPSAVANFKKILLEHCNNESTLRRWLGEYSTGLKQEIDGLCEGLSEQELIGNLPFKLNPFCRVAYSTDKGVTLCFINGCSYACSEQLAQALSSYAAVKLDQFASDQTLLMQLQGQGLLVQAD
ncbi:MAG: 50S ribosomal protein L16 3-hydroxylase [Lentisphaeria bacterium]|jgi:50S ribosomal protein L16 3-hydroxylase